MTDHRAFAVIHERRRRDEDRDCGKEEIRYQFPRLHLVCVAPSRPPCTVRRSVGKSVFLLLFSYSTPRLWTVRGHPDVNRPNALEFRN
jgi:hypothetical protein